MIRRALVLTLALLAVTPASAACLSDREARRAIADYGLLSMRAMREVAREVGGDFVSARLCEGGGGFVYRVAVIDPDGRVARIIVDAASGAIIGGR
jgi:uncharacterized membrane protein YkoI